MFIVVGFPFLFACLFLGIFGSTSVQMWGSSLLLSGLLEAFEVDGLFFVWLALAPLFWFIILLLLFGFLDFWLFGHGFGAF